MISDSPSLLPSVSVVVPCRNGEGTLDGQLQALAGQDYGGSLEVIVVDNGSTDKSVHVARRWPRVKVVTASARSGPNHARNAGASAADGTLILTCDADDVVASSWVSAMVRALDDFDLVGGAMDYSRLNAEAQRWPQSQPGRSKKHGFLPTASGANFGIRASTLGALGGWDESFDGGPDDVELCWRAQLSGFDFAYVPDAVVHYRLRNTTIALARQAFNGGLRKPQLVRRFRSRGMPYDDLVVRAARFGAYIVLAAPAALISRRIRMEWVRRAALGAGFTQGLVRRDTGVLIGQGHES